MSVPSSSPAPVAPAAARFCLCLALLGAVAGGAFTGAARGQSRLYLTEYAFNNPKLKTMLLDGSGLQELTAPPATDWLQVGLDIDPSARKLYWTHGSFPGSIRRANLDGSSPELLVSGLKYPRGIALDTVNGWMYWAEAPAGGNAMGLIRRARLDGTSLQPVYTLTPYDPVGSYVGTPAVDPVNGYVYFSAANEIRRVKLDGSGPVQTLVRGLSTAIALALDVANDRIWFLDANTNSDILGSARLDGEEFTVAVDNSPAFFGSSGLFDLELDRVGGRLYFTDELQKTIRRCQEGGSGLETIYTGPSSHSPTGLTLDLDPPQPVQDCNGNSIRDLDDIEGGASADCDANGIPDECESNPCAPLVWDLDQGSDPAPNGRTLSGDPSSGFEVFQPFEFATIPEEPGLTLAQIGLDGWTINYHPAGFRATIFPDNGAGMPDESQPLGEAVLQFRFSPNTVVWVYADISAYLTSGRYYVRLTAASPLYEASVNVGTSGIHSFSRRLSNGQIIQASTSIALRLRFAGVEDVPASPPASAGRLVCLAPPAPNPFSGRVAAAYAAAAAARTEGMILDASGRVVRKLGTQPGSGAGVTLIWDGRDDAGRLCGSGAYFLRAVATSPGTAPLSDTRRLILLR